MGAYFFYFLTEIPAETFVPQAGDLTLYYNLGEEFRRA